MITKEKAKIILEDKGTEKYTDDEVVEIRKHLYKMAEIAINSYQDKKDVKGDKKI
ncbi:MAG: hypothetical protein ACPG44_02670 [Polaribacter sp.]